MIRFARIGNKPSNNKLERKLERTERKNLYILTEVLYFLKKFFITTPCTISLLIQNELCLNHYECNSTSHGINSNREALDSIIDILDLVILCAHRDSNPEPSYP